MEYRILAGEQVIADEIKKRFSIINVLDDLNVHSFPLAIPLMILFIIRRSGSDEPKQQLLFTVESDADTLITQEIDYDFAESSLVSRTIAEIGSLVITKPCKLTLSIKNDNNDTLRSICTHIYSATLSQTKFPA